MNTNNYNKIYFTLIYIYIYINKCSLYETVFFLFEMNIVNIPEDVYTVSTGSYDIYKEYTSSITKNYTQQTNTAEYFINNVIVINVQNVKIVLIVIIK